MGRPASRLAAPMVRGVALCALVGALSACAMLPASGPSKEAVSEASTVATDQGPLARYELVDIDAAVIDLLRARAADSLLASFGDRRPSAEPLIGVGDLVAVTVWEAGSGGLFSGPLLADRFSPGQKSTTIPPQMVGRDGGISVPYAGRVKVAGRRQQEVGAEIEAALAGKAIQPQVLVSVTSAISNAVTVTGEVTAGARVPLTVKGDRLLEVIGATGGIRAPVHETFVRLSRGNATATVPLTTVVSNPKENIFLRGGDTLTLVRDPQTFVATGATGASFDIPFSAEGITLSQAMAKAGGLRDFQADPAGVFLFRFEPETVLRALRPGSTLIGNRVAPMVYRLNMRDPNSLFLAQGFRMRNRDVLYVSNAPAVELQKVLAVLGPLTGSASSLATSYSYVRNP